MLHLLFWVHCCDDSEHRPKSTYSEPSFKSVWNYCSRKVYICAPWKVNVKCISNGSQWVCVCVLLAEFRQRARCIALHSDDLLVNKATINFLMDFPTTTTFDINFEPMRTLQCTDLLWIARQCYGRSRSLSNQCRILIIVI